MPTFVSDSFADVAGTALAAHVGETGATWTYRSIVGGGNPLPVITDANRLRSVGGGANYGIYYASGVPAGVEYEVTADARVMTALAAYKCGPAGRISSSVGTGYFVQFEAGTYTLYKVVNSSFTVLGTYAGAAVPGTTYALRLTLRNTAKVLSVDGTARITSADNAIAAAGSAGLWVEGAGTNTTGVHFDNLTAADLVAGAAPAAYYTHKRRA